MYKKVLYSSAAILMTVAFSPGASYAQVSDIQMLKDDVKSLKDENKQLREELRKLLAQIRPSSAPAPVAAAPAAPDPKLQAKVEQQQQEIDTLKSKVAAVPPGDKIVTDGSFPGSWKVPGTNVSVKVGGQAAMRATYDVGNATVPGAGGDIVTSALVPLDKTPLAKRKNETRLFVEYSRGNFDARTDTDYGPLRVFTEFDYGVHVSTNGAYQTSNRMDLSLRHAYLDWAGWTFGQTWTTFMDLTFIPEFLDAGPPVGYSISRVPMIRYKAPVPVVGGMLNVAVERADSDVQCVPATAPGCVNNVHTTPFGTPTTSTSFGNGGIAQPYSPAMIANYSRTTPYGEFTVAGMMREIALNDGFGHHGSTWGNGVLVSAHFPGFSSFPLQMHGQGDNWYTWAYFGDGIGYYVADFAGFGGTFDGRNNVKTLEGFSTVAGYQHWWSDKWRSNLGLGFARLYNGGAGDLIPRSTVGYVHYAEQGYLNLMWNPVKWLNFGLEFNSLTRKDQSMHHGTVNRVMFGTTASF